MELGPFWWWVVLVLVQLCITGCFACMEQDRIALLQLKASLKDPNRYGPALPSWNSANEESECCDWERVKCNITTGRVIQLDLNFTSFWNEEYYFNTSLFLPFEEFNSLTWVVTSLALISIDALLNIVLFGFCNPQGFVSGLDLPFLGPNPQQIYHPESASLMCRINDLISPFKIHQLYFFESLAIEFHL